MSGGAEASVRAHDPVIVEGVLELVADRALFALVGIDVRFGEIGVGIDPAIVDAADDAVLDRAVVGQEAAAIVVLVDVAVVGEDGELRRLVRLPGDARRNEAAPAVLLIAVGVAAGDAAVDAIRNRIFVGRIADIEAEIGVAGIVDAGFDVAQRSNSGRLLT